MVRRTVRLFLDSNVILSGLLSDRGAPRIILADEPTGSLDTKASANLRGIFQDLARIENRTIIVVTHDPVFAQAADRRLFILDGHLEPPEKAAEHIEAGIRP